MNKDISHILVVDDDDRIRNLVKEYLEENNFLISTAKNAIDAKKTPQSIRKNVNGPVWPQQQVTLHEVGYDES